MPAVLSIDGLDKAYGGTRALRGVSMELAPGEIHGLVGENGAGKSTLIKIVCGVQQADTGEIRLDGAPFAPASPSEAGRLGVALVPQELRVVPGLSAAQNVFLNDWPTRRLLGLLPALDHAALRARFAELMDMLGVEIDPNAPAGALPVVQRQLLVLARALRRDARVLILDEPTASLERAEVARLFKTLERLRGQGVAIAFVSHRLEEVEALCDRVTVLRDGDVVARHRRDGYAVPDLIREMTGRDLDAQAAPHGRVPGTPALAAEVALADPPVTIEARAGRATGIAGLLGAGGEALLRKLFGAGDPQPVQMPSGSRVLRRPRDAIAAGLGHVPSERRLGIVPGLSVFENILLPHLYLADRPDRAAVTRLIAALDIRPADPDARAGGLSGGNQQKVIFARWLAGRPQALLLDEPTHGVDIGAKAHIHRLIHEYVSDGGAALIHSAEFHELMGLCDEVIALREGRDAGRFARGAPDYTETALRDVLGG